MTSAADQTTVSAHVLKRRTGHALGSLAQSRSAVARVVPRPVRTYVVLDPGLVTRVLADSAGFQKTIRRHHARYLVGDGSGTSREASEQEVLKTYRDPDEFRRTRRDELRPAFQPRLLGRQSAIAVQSARTVLDEWRPGEARDVLADCVRLSLDATCRTFFAMQPSPNLEEAAAVVLETSAAMARRMRTWFLPGLRAVDRGMSPGLLPPWMLRCTRDGRAMDRRRRILAAWPDLLADCRRVGDEAPTLPRTSTGLFFASYENTATTLTWALWLLAKHPEAQERVATSSGEERRGRLEAVCAETLRLYPPVWSTVRENIRDVQHGNLVLPAGSLLVLSPWIQHRQPQHWPEPSRFNPERFQAPVTHGTYYPFASGPAMCPGRRVAITSLVAILDMVVDRFRLTVDDHGPQPKPLLANIQHPHPSCWIRPFSRH